MQSPLWTNMLHEKHVVSLKSWADTMIRNHNMFKENSMLILAKHTTSLYDARISVKKMQHCLGEKMKSPVNQKYCFFLFMLAFKICNKEAKTTLSFEYGATGQTWIPSISNIHWLNTIFHSNNLCITLYNIIYIYIFLQLNIYFQAILMALLKFRIL